MSVKKAWSFNSLVEQHLGTCLPDRLAEKVVFSELSEEAQGFILSMLTLMQLAKYPATDFTPLLTDMLSGMIPNMLPSAWGGRIPPLTMPGRHRRFDDYVSAQSWTKMDAPLVFVDVGCGFPPVTTADTAKRFPEWRIYGVDRSFARYVVYDPEGNYACIGRNGEFLYFQAQMDKKGRSMYENPAATRQRFESIFADLRPLLLSPDGRLSETVENDRGKLIRNHIRNFETENLTFEESGIDGARIPPARVVRCMNLLIYYTPERRKQILASLGDMLCDGGILIAGTNGNNFQSRYAVYRKRVGEPTQSEFSFSLDNLRAFGVMPWFTIHANDPEASLLAELTGRIRSHRDFWPAFSRRVDDLLNGCGICRRADDGYMEFFEPELPVPALITKMEGLWRQIADEGYSDRVVDVLRQNDYEAWLNPVGDITVRPRAGSLPSLEP